jgi:hypothetical protein
MSGPSDTSLNVSESRGQKRKNEEEDLAVCLAQFRSQLENDPGSSAFRLPENFLGETKVDEITETLCSVADKGVVALQEGSGMLQVTNTIVAHNGALRHFQGTQFIEDTRAFVQNKFFISIKNGKSEATGAGTQEGFQYFDFNQHDKCNLKPILSYGNFQIKKNPLRNNETYFEHVDDPAQSVSTIVYQQTLAKFVPKEVDLREKRAGKTLKVSCSSPFLAAFEKNQKAELVAIHGFVTIVPEPAKSRVPADTLLVMGHGSRNVHVTHLMIKNFTADVASTRAFLSEYVNMCDIDSIVKDYFALPGLKTDTVSLSESGVHLFNHTVGVLKMNRTLGVTVANESFPILCIFFTMERICDVSIMRDIAKTSPQLYENGFGSSESINDCLHLHDVNCILGSTIHKNNFFCGLTEDIVKTRIIPVSKIRDLFRVAASTAPNPRLEGGTLYKAVHVGKQKFAFMTSTERQIFSSTTACNDYFSGNLSKEYTQAPVRDLCSQATVIAQNGGSILGVTSAMSAALDVNTAKNKGVVVPKLKRALFGDVMDSLDDLTRSALVESINCKLRPSSAGGLSEAKLTRQQYRNSSWCMFMDAIKVDDSNTLYSVCMNYVFFMVFIDSKLYARDLLMFYDVSEIIEKHESTLFDQDTPLISKRYAVEYWILIFVNTLRYTVDVLAGKGRPDTWLKIDLNGASRSRRSEDICKLTLELPDGNSGKFKSSTFCDYSKGISPKHFLVILARLGRIWNGETSLASIKADLNSAEAQRLAVSFITQIVELRDALIPQDFEASIDGHPFNAEKDAFSIPNMDSIFSDPLPQTFSFVEVADGGGTDGGN